VNDYNTSEYGDAPPADHARPDPALVARLAALPAANIGDSMERLGILDSRIQAVWPGARVAGPALTVWTRSGDNLLIHQALTVVRPGDVIVVNGQGDESRALIGELMGGIAKNRGAAGFVIDGAIRDADALGELGMPVFARASTPAGPYKNGPGRMHETIAVGGVAVAPGDILVGDGDGVVCVPMARAADIADAAEAVFRKEEQKRAEIERGA
jgi:regulator of RNase E activity RraA